MWQGSLDGWGMRETSARAVSLRVRDGLSSGWDLESALPPGDPGPAPAPLEGTARAALGALHKSTYLRSLLAHVAIVLL